MGQQDQVLHTGRQAAGEGPPAFELQMLSTGPGNVPGAPKLVQMPAWQA